MLTAGLKPCPDTNLRSTFRNDPLRQNADCRTANSLLHCFSVCGFPFCLQGGEEVGAAVGAEEFVVFDHGGGADAGRRQRMFDADYAGGETDANGVGEGDVGREGQRDFEFGAGGDGAVEVEENAAGADVLGFGWNSLVPSSADDGGQAHVEAPHHPPFL